MLVENPDGFQVSFKKIISTHYGNYNAVEFKREFFLRKSDGWTRELIEEFLRNLK